MSLKNGVWHDAKIDLPEDNVQVLAVKELKSGKRDLCLAYCIANYEHYDPVKKEKCHGPYWVCGGNNNIIYWMPLPKIPEEAEDGA